jgi:hypothetical protein
MGLEENCFHPHNKPKRIEIRITANQFSTFCIQQWRVLRKGGVGGRDKNRPSDISYVNH